MRRAVLCKHFEGRLWPVADSEPEVATPIKLKYLEVAVEIHAFGYIIQKPWQESNGFQWFSCREQVISFLSYLFFRSTIFRTILFLDELLNDHHLGSPYYLHLNTYHVPNPVTDESDRFILQTAGEC